MSESNSKEAQYNGDRTARAEKVLADYTAAAIRVAVLEAAGKNTGHSYTATVADRDILRGKVIIPAMARGFEEL